MLRVLVLNIGVKNEKLEPIQINMQNNQRTTVVVVQSKKSMGLAFILTFLFGPLGMLYSTVAGGIIMMILTPIIGIGTLGVGLIIMWPIQLIWACMAVNSRNNKIDAAGKQTVTVSNKPLQTDTGIKVEIRDNASESIKETKKELRHYNDANKLTDNQIEKMLLDGDDLSADFVEALKFVQNERVANKEIVGNRKKAFAKALELNEGERKDRIASPSLYSAVSISALVYIQRCKECELEPTESGFLSTFEQGYIAPETPSERTKREQQEQEQAERDQKRAEEKRARVKEEIERAEQQKRMSIIIFLIIIVSGSAIGIYTMLIKPNSDYNKIISLYDTRFENFDSTASLDVQKKELITIKGFYYSLEQDLPNIKKDERTKYIQSKINDIDERLALVYSQIEMQENEQAAIKAAAEKQKALAAQKRAEANKAAKEAEAQKAIEAEKIRKLAEAKERGYSTIETNPKYSSISKLYTDQNYTKITFETKAPIQSGWTYKIYLNPRIYLKCYTSTGEKILKFIKAENIAVLPNKNQYRGERKVYHVFFEPIPSDTEKFDIITPNDESMTWFGIKPIIE